LKNLEARSFFRVFLCDSCDVVVPVLILAIWNHEIARDLLSRVPVIKKRRKMTST
jgi:hypothetical protein